LQAGAKQAPSPRAVAMVSDIVITMLPNSPEVEEIVTGEQGILTGARKGLIIVDMSTIAPATSRKLGELAATRGAHVLDGPVIGVSAGASSQLSTQFPLRAFNGSFQPGFMTDLLHKDLGLALDLAAENHTTVPMTALSRQLYEMARAAGYGREDYTSLLKVLE